MSQYSKIPAALVVHSANSPEARCKGPFWPFLAGLKHRPPLRSAITAATRVSEESCVAELLSLAALDPPRAAAAMATATRLVEALRGEDPRGGVQGLVHEYSLSSQEGVALMCLAEALLRVPDAATRHALIRDKIADGDWRAHLGNSPSLFVNAATWGLVFTGKLTATSSESSLSAALTRLIGRGGEPVIRKGVDLAMRMMGEQFVTGQTIEEALRNSRRLEAKGFRYSYDMLGEAATTAEDAARYFKEYENAIHAIGGAAKGRGIYEGPGISIKLSALHPRYFRAKIDRVMHELLPRVQALAELARRYDIGLNIDAEEADRLELSLDILEALCFAPDLAGWNGIGFVIQAYQKRCPRVVDWIVDLARRSQRRLMIRLVKGAYWDSEIKRAQLDGLDGYPVFTRKIHTDVSYLACARQLLAAPDAVFPQFATHNAQTVAAVMALAGPNFYKGQYEFQCLHGMGEPLYEQVVGPQKLDRPCRIYAPVGTHETLLAYLVRRLLENGANSSFVNRIADARVPVCDLVADPVATVAAMQPLGSPHEKIAHPRKIYGERLNAAGIDLSSEQALGDLGAGLAESAEILWRAEPSGTAGTSGWTDIRNPADHRDIVGHMREAQAGEIDAALAAAASAAATFSATAPEGRAAILDRAAEAFEAKMPVLIGLIVREAGKSYANAVAEVREAVDFLRYYAAEAERTLGSGRHFALGPVVCISPWNFPLAIFTGQVAAALAAGNAVLAKPAEETPLIAAEAVRILLAAGVPADALQLLPGDGKVGAALVADARVQGVMFTGSTEVARLIQRGLSTRLTADGQPIPLIAETGGQNALVVDSSALAEQVVADVIASAFDSAGQRCSALRILCLQEDIAERTLAMLQGAVEELSVGNPVALATDVGPVISPDAQKTIASHIETMRARGHRIFSAVLGKETDAGTFIAPTIIEIGRIADVEREVFGPVLHVLRYRREEMDRLIDDINATGYGLTFGLHTRIDETISRVVGRVAAGNIYINRNIIGAVVGVQPFGGSGLSGTGPKAGGPLYLGRLLSVAPPTGLEGADANGAAQSILRRYCEWLRGCGHADVAETCADYGARSALGARMELSGPVGERNVYALVPRGRVLALASSEPALLAQVGAILATGNTAVVERADPSATTLGGLPPELGVHVQRIGAWRITSELAMILFEGGRDELLMLNADIARRDGAIVTVIAKSGTGDDYPLLRLLEERSISTNTAAAGGNASLMSIG